MQDIVGCFDSRSQNRHVNAAIPRIRDLIMKSIRRDKHCRLHEFAQQVFHQCQSPTPMICVVVLDQVHASLRDDCSEEHEGEESALDFQGMVVAERHVQEGAT